jgi:quercetin dioxygenase-like cupin family protein
MKALKQSPTVFVIVWAMLVTSVIIFAQQSNQHKASAKQSGISASMAKSPDDVKWEKAPDALPPGAQMAVLEGDPMGKDLYTLRLKLPASYKIPPHSHPTAEYLTVISGSFNVGMGDAFSEKNAQELKTGGFGMMPANQHHFAFANGETVVQIHGKGPFQITYVNPKDDPRKSTTSRISKENFPEKPKQ